MNEILEFINENTWLNILFILLTLTSIFLSIWFYNKSKKSKKPSYCVRTINLVKEKINKIDSVDILYQGDKIENLSISKLAIWNAGKETISQIDIAQNDKFCIEINENNKILDHELVFEKNSANGFKLVKENNSIINIDFDYFDYNEGIIIQIYHTATDDSLLKLKGSFKGTNQIVRNDSIPKLLPQVFYNAIDKKKLKPRFIKKILGLITIILPLILIITLFLDIGKGTKIEPTLFSKLLIIGFITIPYWWVGFMILKRRVPKGFNLFEDEF